MKSKTLGILAASLLLAVTPAAAGVVFEIEVTDHQQSSAETQSTEMAAEGRSLKMDVAPGESGRGKGEMIYRGDRREVVVVDHDEKSYMVIDEAAMAAVAGQVSAAMKQMQEALENVPEEQRAMVERMMRERMPQQQPAPRRPTSELRRTGERASKNGYPCVKYEVWRGGAKLRELWVTDWSNVEGGKEVVGVFEEMADFFQELMDSLPDFGQGGGVGDSAFEHMRQIGGFPVVTREFDPDGSLESESNLRSSRRRTLDPSEFEPPAGYKRRSMSGGS